MLFKQIKDDEEEEITGNTAFSQIGCYSAYGKTLRIHNTDKILQELRNSFSFKFENPIYQRKINEIASEINNHVQIVETLNRNLLDDIDQLKLDMLNTGFFSVFSHLQYLISYLRKTLTQLNQSHETLARTEKQSGKSSNTQQCDICFQRLEQVRIANIEQQLSESSFHNRTPLLSDGEVKQKVKDVHQDQQKLTFQYSDNVLNILNSLISEFILKKQYVQSMNNNKTITLLQEFLKEQMYTDEASNTLTGFTDNYFSRFKNGNEIISHIYSDMSKSMLATTKKDMMPVVHKIAKNFERIHLNAYRKTLQEKEVQTVEVKAAAPVTSQAVNKKKSMNLNNRGDGNTTSDLASENAEYKKRIQELQKQKMQLQKLVAGKSKGKKTPQNNTPKNNSGESAPNNSISNNTDSIEQQNDEGVEEIREYYEKMVADYKEKIESLEQEIISNIKESHTVAFQTQFKGITLGTQTYLSPEDLGHRTTSTLREVEVQIEQEPDGQSQVETDVKNVSFYDNLQEHKEPTKHKGTKSHHKQKSSLVSTIKTNQALHRSTNIFSNTSMLNNRRKTVLLPDKHSKEKKELNQVSETLQNHHKNRQRLTNFEGIHKSVSRIENNMQWAHSNPTEHYQASLATEEDSKKNTEEDEEINHREAEVELAKRSNKHIGSNKHSPHHSSQDSGAFIAQIPKNVTAEQKSAYHSQLQSIIDLYKKNWKQLSAINVSEILQRLCSFKQENNGSISGTAMVVKLRKYMKQFQIPLPQRRLPEVEEESENKNHPSNNASARANLIPSQHHPSIVGKQTRIPEYIISTVLEESKHQSVCQSPRNNNPPSVDESYTKQRSDKINDLKYRKHGTSLTTQDESFRVLNDSVNEKRITTDHTEAILEEKHKNNSKNNKQKEQRACTILPSIVSGQKGKQRYMTHAEDAIERQQNEQQSMKQPLTDKHHYRQTKKKEIVKGIFSVQDLELFGGMAEAYKYELLNVKNSIKKHAIAAEEEALCTPKDNRLIEMVYAHVQSLKPKQQNLYQNVKSFIKFPYQSVVNSFHLADTSKNIGLNQFKECFYLICRVHQSCMERGECVHLERFLTKIGYNFPDFRKKEVKNSPQRSLQKDQNTQSVNSLPRLLH